MPLPSENTTSLAKSRARRQNVPVPARAQQEVEARRKERLNHDDGVARRVAQTEAETRPEPAHDDDNFIFGSPIPEPLPSEFLQQDNFDRSSKLAMFYLRKVALSEAKDLRAAYERGEIGLEELREAAADPHANEQEDDQPADVPETTPTGRKGKGRATGPAAESQVATNYTGITASDTSHPVQSKHALAAARHDRNQAKRNASQGSPLVHTDTSTVYPDKQKTYPMTPSSLPRPQTGSQPAQTRPTSKSRPAHQPPASGGRTTTAQSAASQAPRAVGKILVPATQEDASQQRPARIPRPNQQRDDCAPTQVNADTRNMATRRPQKRADRRYTPINIGSRPPNRPKPNDTRTKKLTSKQNHHCPAAVRNPPVENEADKDDAGAGNNNVDGINPGEPVKTANKTKANSVSIGGHLPETQKTVRKMLESAVAHVVAGGTYEWTAPGTSVVSREDIASKAWAFACRETKSNYPMQDSHLSLLNAHSTTSRSRAKAVLKPEIDMFFGFDPDNVKKNAELSKELLTHGFHQADRKNNRLNFQSKYLRRACRAVAFNGAGSYGAKFPKAFVPFPVTFVAFVCAISNHIIYCYRDGRYASAETLRVPMQIWAFRQYMTLLTDMGKHQENIFSNVIGTISDYCRKSVAAIPEANPAEPEPMRQWSPDVAEPYKPQFPDPSSDDEMMQENDADQVKQQSDDEYDQPLAGPSRHRGAYVSEDDDEPTDEEAGEDVELDEEGGSDMDEEELGD